MFNCSYSSLQKNYNRPTIALAEVQIFSGVNGPLVDTELTNRITFQYVGDDETDQSKLLKNLRQVLSFKMDVHKGWSFFKQLATFR